MKFRTGGGSSGVFGKREEIFGRLVRIRHARGHVQAEKENYRKNASPEFKMWELNVEYDLHAPEFAVRLFADVFSDSTNDFL